MSTLTRGTSTYCDFGDSDARRRTPELDSVNDHGDSEDELCTKPESRSKLYLIYLAALRRHTTYISESRVGRRHGCVDLHGGSTRGGGSACYRIVAQWVVMGLK